VDRLDETSRETGAHAFGVLGVVLREGERVDCVVQGRFNDANGVLALTSQRLIAVNDKGYKPDVVEIAMDRGLDAQGWQEDDTSAVMMRRPERTVVIDLIADGQVAAELVNQVRARIG
jgi:hypothetical protein